jgi:excisionase family DNA binding protein
MTVPTASESRFMTAIQVAKLLQVSPDQVRIWAHDGVLPGRWLGRGVGYRFTHADVEALLEAKDRERNR